MKVAHINQYSKSLFLGHLKQSHPSSDFVMFKLILSIKLSTSVIQKYM